MTEVLTACYVAAQREAEIREAEVSFGELEWKVAELNEPARFTEMLASSPGVAVIAEHKRRSPSEGEIRPGSSVAWTVEQYRQGGAVALSILTQKKDFDGEPKDMIEARKTVDLPILRKDFIKTPYQLYEAKVFGADAVLLIVAGLSDTELIDLHEEASDIGLDCLVEVHDEQEMERALEIGPRLIGINNRNLNTLQIDRSTVPELIGKVPKGIIKVAASDYHVSELKDMDELRSLGADAVLVGTDLMRAENPAAALRRWLGSI